MTTGFAPSELDGRRAIVTGAASGIGKGTAIKLAELGAHVVASDIDEAGAARVAEQIGGTSATLDVTDPEAWDRVVAVAGPFDIAFLNAGVATQEGLPPGGIPIAELTDDAYRRIMSINVDGVVYGTRAVLPGMIERGAGDIVATASLAGLVPIASDPIYGLTKHAVVGFVRSLGSAFEQNPEAPDVCFSAICPGFTDTNIIGDEAKAMVVERGIELMTTERVAGVVARSLAERQQGAQWVIWPGEEPEPYEWNAPVEFPDP